MTFGNTHTWQITILGNEVTAMENKYIWIFAPKVNNKICKYIQSGKFECLEVATKINIILSEEN